MGATQAPQGLTWAALIPLTTAEIRRLFSEHTRINRQYAYHERWSCWRRPHQATAQRSHYKRRLTANHRLGL